MRARGVASSLARGTFAAGRGGAAPVAEPHRGPAGTLRVLPPKSTDETVRIRAGASAQPHPAGPPPRGHWGRRLLLGGGALILAGAAAAIVLWPEAPPVPQRLGPRRLAPPMLRMTVGSDELVLLLTRRTEQDETDPADAPPPRDRIELLALSAVDLAPRFAVHLASVPRGGLPDAGLIAGQGATIWLWLGSLGAVSAVDGRLLADSAGLAEINPAIANALGAGRRAIRVDDAIVVETGQGWRIDPRDFRASPAKQPAPRPLPMIRPAAPFGTGGPTAFRVAEARLDAAWFGLPAEGEKLLAPLAPRAAGRFLGTAAPAPGTRQALWRGAVRVGSLAPPDTPANLQSRWGIGERLVDLATVPAVTGLSYAGFLTAGTAAPLVLSGPPGLLLLHGAVGEQLGLARIGADGAPQWQAPLPVTRLRSVLPGPRHLVLAGWGASEAEDLVVSVALDTGVLAVRPVSA